jgi:alpha/beta superfamily hydrolase
MSEMQLIPGPVGDLEIMVTEPKIQPRAVAVICHPHPLHGGTMHNKVVTALAKACLEQGAIVLRFNYRGVQQSVGEFDDAVGECDDCRAVIDWVMRHYPNLPLWLAGFSFGAYIATRVAHDDDLATLCIAIAPAIKHYSFDELTQLGCPWLVVQGDQDEVAPCAPVQAWWALVPKQARQQLQILSGAGHFFHGRLIELRDIVNEWIRQVS